MKTIISIVIGMAGFIPFLVHKLLINKKEYFNKPISNILIFGNIISGILLIITGIIEK
jgi:DMSO/TMAO reductase YedYZ heme-binding membrane subunit